MRRRFHHRPHLLTGSLLLLGLVLRALIPVGFMPSPDRPFRLDICPDSFPVQLLAHAHQTHHSEHGVSEPGPSPAQLQQPSSHGHNSAPSDHCIFAALCGEATPSQVQPFVVPPAPSQQSLRHQPRRVLSTQRHPSQQPRGPPLA